MIQMIQLQLLTDFLKIISKGTPLIIVDHETKQELLNTESYSAESTLKNVRSGIEYKVTEVTLSGWYLLVWVDGTEVKDSTKEFWHCDDCGHIFPEELEDDPFRPTCAKCGSERIQWQTFKLNEIKKGGEEE